MKRQQDIQRILEEFTGVKNIPGINSGEILEEETVDFDVEAWNDVTGKALDPKAVRQARLKEMKYVKEKEVWQPISRDEARRRGWKVLKTSWIDIN